MNKTSIAWTDYTSNPLRAVVEDIGATTSERVERRGHYCEKVSPGCANCYASAFQGRFGTGVEFPANPIGSKGGVPAEREHVRTYLDERELLEWQKPKYAGKRCFAFDMTDLFGEWVSDETLDKVFAAMALAQDVTFQILTKRPERMRDYLAYAFTQDHVEAAADLMLADQGKEGVCVLTDCWPLPNVSLGVTAELQRWADLRVPVLLDTPAATRFVSCEPLLQNVHFVPEWLYPSIRCTRCGCLMLDWRAQEKGYCYSCVNPMRGLPVTGGLDWVIVGGESGPTPRPMAVEWARSIRDQCATAGVPFFMKQMGGKRFPDDRLESLPADLRVREFPTLKY